MADTDSLPELSTPKRVRDLLADHLDLVHELDSFAGTVFALTCNQPEQPELAWINLLYRQSERLRDSGEALSQAYFKALRDRCDE